MFVKIKETGVLVPCEKGVDGEYAEEGMSLEDAFNKHGKWINPLRPANAAVMEESTAALGVRALDFVGCQIRDASVRKLAHILKVNTTITRLNLAWNSIGSKGATYISESLVRNTTLTHLDLSHNEIQDPGAEQLACSLGGDAVALKLHGITTEEMWYELDPKFEPTGGGNMSLLTLSLGHNPIEQKGCMCLLTALAFNGGLASVSLGGRIMMGREHRLLGEALWCNWHITDLDLSDSEIDPRAAKALAKVISRPHGTLRALDLSRNKFGDQGATAIANALQPIALSLDDEIVVSENTISVGHVVRQEPFRGIRTFLTGTRPDETGMRGGESDGCGSFTDAEIVQPSLTSLNLTGCKIRSHGMTEIAMAIRKNERLKTLYLSDNWCEDQGATALSRALQHNTCIESVYFYDNSIQLDAVKTITEILERTASLKHTDLVFEIGRGPAVKSQGYVIGGYSRGYRSASPENRYTGTGASVGLSRPGIPKFQHPDLDKPSGSGLSGSDSDSELEPTSPSLVRKGTPEGSKTQTQPKTEPILSEK